MTDTGSPSGIADPITPGAAAHAEAGGSEVEGAGTAPAAVSKLPQPVRDGFWRRYGRLWVYAPREVGVLFVLFPLAIVAMSVLWPVFFTGVGTVVIYIGIFLLVASLYAARGYGMFTLALLRAAGRPGIPRPPWREQARHGFIGRVFGPFANGHYWLYLLYSSVVQLPVSILTWSVLITWLSAGVGGASYWIWGGFVPHDNGNIWIAESVWEHTLHTSAPFAPAAGDLMLYSVVGIVFLFTLPFVTRGLITLQWVVARGLLGSWESEQLRKEVDELAISRAAAVAAEDRELRRLERDIHDGPQQQLVRLRMDIAAAQRRLSVDPDATSRLLDEAGGRAQEALDELRALSRGFAPPILQDRGLSAALDSLATRSTVPVTVTTELSPTTTLSPELERNLYFVAAELLTNVAKHAKSAHADITLKTDAAGVSLTVADNGVGGATEVSGHGLAGIRERVTAMRGTAGIQSGSNGTAVTVIVPLS
ncbi:sensor histidine kinase [Humibacter ginsenosidimutans]|uniref:histidine kinase n=1 Tax=Humibacter ginsenosidimutans TaxID=2599293 RepID=A0A5B8M228_9MICO|nr:sensor histidine kinase [Humibacter ginsenosidimutans]QDZ14004.1 sensor histidine kinase [Humibacter ginsenosidimutans]